MMSNVESNNFDSNWIKYQIVQFAELRPRYEEYEQTLLQILSQLTRQYLLLPIIQLEPNQLQVSQKKYRENIMLNHCNRLQIYVVHRL